MSHMPDYNSLLEPEVLLPLSLLYHALVKTGSLLCNVSLGDNGGFWVHRFPIFV